MILHQKNGKCWKLDLKVHAKPYICSAGWQSGKPESCMDTETQGGSGGKTGQHKIGLSIC